MLVYGGRGALCHGLRVLSKANWITQQIARRNGCSHPNSLKIGANTAAHHIEILLLNVFQKF